MPKEAPKFEDDQTRSLTVVSAFEPIPTRQGENAAEPANPVVLFARYVADLYDRSPLSEEDQAAFVDMLYGDYRKAGEMALSQPTQVLRRPYSRVPRRRAYKSQTLPNGISVSMHPFAGEARLDVGYNLKANLRSVNPLVDTHNIQIQFISEADDASTLKAFYLFDAHLDVDKDGTPKKNERKFSVRFNPFEFRELGPSHMMP